jgi:hypothetical protein
MASMWPDSLKRPRKRPAMTDGPRDDRTTVLPREQRPRDGFRRQNGPQSSRANDNQMFLGCRGPLTKSKLTSTAVPELRKPVNDSEIREHLLRDFSVQNLVQTGSCKDSRNGLYRRGVIQKSSDDLRNEYSIFMKMMENDRFSGSMSNQK